MSQLRDPLVGVSAERTVDAAPLRPAPRTSATIAEDDQPRSACGSRISTLLADLSQPVSLAWPAALHRRGTPCVYVALITDQISPASLLAASIFANFSSLASSCRLASLT